MTQTQPLLSSPLLERFAIQSVRDFYDNDVAAFKEFAGPNDSLLIGFILARWRELNGDVAGKDDLLGGVVQELAAEVEPAEDAEEASGDDSESLREDASCPVKGMRDPVEIGINHGETAARQRICVSIDTEIEIFKKRASIADLMILNELLNDHESFAYPDKCCFPYLMETVIQGG